jgi:hypothetical protein
MIDGFSFQRLMGYDDFVDFFEKSLGGGKRVKFARVLHETFIVHSDTIYRLLDNRSYKLFDKFNDKSMRSILSGLINLSVEQLEDTHNELAKTL